ncbi:MAG: hypothetical protein E7596_03945 [Ruminococcaceae bacterium]|nr:hypothetical protein [Oscillospiraceae bacterium]
MKKRLLSLTFLCIVLLGILVFLVACGNYDFIDTNYTFSKAYVKIGDQWMDLEIKSWTDYEGEQIQLTLADGTVMLVNSVNCILYEGELPKGDK